MASHLSPHFFAWLNEVGLFLSLLGTLYWAYEILGGRDGPLGLLTRAVTYSALSVLVYGLLMGLVFGVVAGIGLGTILALEFFRVARYQRKYGASPLLNSPWSGAVRGVVLGLASWHSFGGRFALVFGALSAAGLYVVYFFRFSPTFDYRSHRKPEITRHRLASSLWRGTAVGLAGTAAAAVLPNSGWHSLASGVFFGFAALTGSVVTSTVSPLVEYWIDNLPERRAAAIGVVLVLSGTLMQGVQPFLAILDK